MYAVIRTGGKQYRVAADEVVTIEKVRPIIIAACAVASQISTTGCSTSS